MQTIAILFMAIALIIKITKFSSKKKNNYQKRTASKPVQRPKTSRYQIDLDAFWKYVDSQEI